jgi:hypothetical protein
MMMAMTSAAMAIVRVFMGISEPVVIQLATLLRFAAPS